MTLPSHGASRRTAACGVLLAVAAAIAACGGGSVGSGGTGGPEGLAVGTVNGFGSVIVDGIHYDDHMVAAVREDHLGRPTRVELALGQRVTIGLGEPGKVESLQVVGAVRGPVGLVGAGQFVVMGQTVLVNLDSRNGPVTQFGGGYTGLADMQASDLVDVHGIVVAQGAATVVQATRVQREAGEPEFFQATGVVSARNPDGTGFRLGALAVTIGAASVEPPGALLQNGQLVRVMAPPAALAGTGFAASRVIVQTPSPTAHAVRSGSIVEHDPAARVFLIGTERVDYGAATLTPPTLSPQVGQYVRVRGAVRDDGTLVAEEVELRDGLGEAEAELSGNVGDLDAVARTFTVRGVQVDFGRITPERCGTGLVDGAFVEVEGRLQPTGVQATRVVCESEAVGSTVERRGTASDVSLDERTFTLTTPAGAVAVSWSDTTFFRDIAAAELDGQLLLIEGELNASGVLEASKVRRQPVPAVPAVPTPTAPTLPAPAVGNGG